MATTTNYSWTTPDDTGLVKDGASAIRTLGSSIDTTTKALNPSTTLGDIEYRSSTANTNTRLGIGSTGQVLTVTGGVPAWSTISAGGMTLLSTTSLSGTSTTISSISQDYTKLFLNFVDVYFATDGYNFWLRCNSDSSTKYFASFVRAAGGTTEGLALGADTKAIIGRSTTLTTQVYKLSGSFELSNYTSTGTKVGFGSFTMTNGTDNYGGFTTMKYTGTSAISSLTFTADGSVSTTAGTVYLYGVK